MRIARIALVVVFSFILSACVSSLIVGDAQSRLMWAMLKPLVGFDPNEVNLFEQPMIKNRMVKLLGSHYDSTMKLLKTANEIRQEGALFYVVSRYTPLPGIARKTAEKAGFVWNADTNQMAVMLVTGGAPTILAEQVEKAKTALIPSWPAELQQVIAAAEEKQQALQDSAVKKTSDLIGEALGLEGDQPLLEQVIEGTLEGKSAKDMVEEKAETEGEKIIEDSGIPLRQLEQLENIREEPETVIEQELERILEKNGDDSQLQQRPKEKTSAAENDQGPLVGEKAGE